MVSLLGLRLLSSQLVFPYLTLEMSGILPFSTCLLVGLLERKLTADPSMVLCGCPQVIRMVKWPCMSDLFFSPLLALWFY